MIDTIYREAAVRDHPRSREIVKRFSGARLIDCERYGEVFNPAAQNFRIQKERPALILARKHEHFVHEAPLGLGIGGERNFYFSHMLNCLYDCRYCFLQGMFRSAHYLLFVNYEEFQAAIDRHIAADGPTYFFSGYDCDSLALESVTRFAHEFLPFFATRPRAMLELRTKSVGVQPLLRRAPLANVVVAFSFTPRAPSEAFENGVPSVAARIEALHAVAAHGWPVGIRLDPLLHYEGWQQGYESLIRRVFDGLEGTAVHSVSLGPLRFPRDMLRRIRALYPDEPLLAGALEERGAMASYPSDRESMMTEFVCRRLASVVPRSKTFVSPAVAA